MGSWTVAYWVAQVTGGTAGGALLYFLLGAESSLGATVLDEGVSPGKGLILDPAAAAGSRDEIAARLRQFAGSSSD